MFSVVQQRVCLYLVILMIVIPAQGIKRTIGPPNDYRFIDASRICNISAPESFEFNICSHSIDCVYVHITEALKASLASGTSIAALLPTILALIGAPSLEIVQIALLSPHRALATCCFTIGLPSGLFRQLRPLGTHLSVVNPQNLRTRQWITPLSPISHKSWKNIAAKVSMDLLILALASIMIWRNWVVSSFTMVPWRCEYSYLIFAWPLACMSWLVIAIGLLVCMKESIEVHDGYGEKLQYSILELICVPYVFGKRKPPSSLLSTAVKIQQDGTRTLNLERIDTGKPASPQTPMQAQRCPCLAIHPTNTIGSYNNSYIRVSITMPTNSGFRSWGCYEAIIESLAVGIYLYATFVLTSVMFLNADKAIVFATVMTTCLSAIRVLTTLF